MTRIVLLFALLMSLAMSARAQQPAGTIATYDFDIPSMSLRAALGEFQERAGVGVSYLPDTLNEGYSSAIRGQFTAPEALQRMLAGADLDVEWVKRDAVYIGIMTRKTMQRFAAAGLSKFDGMGAGDAPYDRVYPLFIDRIPLSDLIQPLSYYFGLLFQVSPSDESLLRAYVGPFNGSLTPAETLDYLLQGTAFTWEWAGEETIKIRKRGRAEMPDVTVEASRLFTLTSDQPPSAILSKEEIGRLGVTTVAEAMQYLPQQPFSHFGGFRSDGAQSVQLRGLGFDTTLVLINGHPVGASANLYDTNAFDLNTIPLAAVERMEVWLDATPMSVGAAIGGMLNIVLRSDFDQPAVDLHYGSAEGGARERRVSLAGEVSAERLHFRAMIDYLTRDALQGSSRDRWRNQDYRRFGGTDFRSPDANPGNVSALTADNLPGLPARFAAVPPHQSGEALTVSDFLLTAGQQNLESVLAYRSITPEIENVSAVASADWKLAPQWVTFAEGFYARRKTSLRDLPLSVSDAVVPASNAYNPFDVPVRSNFLLTAIDHERMSRTEFARGLLGLRGHVGDWKAELTLLRTDDRSVLSTGDQLDPMRLGDALAESDPDQTLNVFDDGPGGSPALLTSLLASSAAQTYSSDLTEVKAQVRGDVFALPAGAASLLLGAQRRELQIDVDGLQLGRAERTSHSAFAELRVPLLAESIPVLSATLQGRLDELSDLGTMRHSQLTLDWSLNRGLALRATAGSSYRAPSLYELYQPTMTLPTRLPDPRRDNELTNVAITFGGSPELKPATADSWSIGLTLQPQWPSRLNVSMTYWQTEIENRLTPVELISLLTSEDLFPGRLTRNAPTAADLALGQPGTMRSIDVTAGAEGSLTASGIDIQASVHLDTPIGTITPAVAATWMNQFAGVDWPGLPSSDRVGVASTFGTIPKWRGIASLTWRRGCFTFTTKARLNSEYADLDPLMNQRTGRHIDAQPLVDIQASCQLDRSHDQAWRDIRITTGVINVFDDSPPFAEIGANFGFDVSQGDLRGRFGYLRLSKEF